MYYGYETLKMLREHLTQNEILYRHMKEEGYDRDLIAAQGHTLQDLRISIKVLEDYLNKKR